MAGHSKFKNIMHRKGRQDAVRSKMFAKLSKEITVAAKIAGSDIDGNPRLRLAVANAKGQSMPKDNIQRAIDKGSGNDTQDFFEIRYEGYGPGGVAVIVEALSDNKNRTAGSVRARFTKNGGQLGENGCVSFMFDRVGEVTYPAEVADEEKIMEAAINAGASDASFDEIHTITCPMEELNDVTTSLTDSLGEPKSVEITWKPKNTVELDEEKAKTMIKLIHALEDDDDVQTVHANFEIAEEIMERISEG